MASSFLNILPTAALYTLGILVPLALFYLSYQVTFHPLRAYPGPLIAKFTNAYGAFHVVRRCMHLATYNDHLRYGSVVRLGPNRLVFNTAAAEDIYANSRVNKGRSYSYVSRSGNPSMWSTLDREAHHRKRKLVGPVVSERSMRAFEPTMSATMDIFLRQLLESSQQGSPVNMTERCERLAVDIVGLLAFGYPLNTQTEETNKLVPDSLKTTSTLSTLIMAWPATRIVAPLLGWLGRKRAATFRLALRKMIGARMALPKDAKHDFYALATGEISPGEQGLSAAELWPEAVFFIAAGGGTVNTAMTASFFYLSRYPAAYAHLAREIRTTFSSGREIRQGPRLAGCKYLRAVIDEVLRIAPASLAYTWREQDTSSAAAGETLVVDGHIIPPGTEVAVNLYALLHNAEYFPEPFNFQPGRWLAHEHETDQEREVRATMRRAFQPFLLGDRGCAGKAMAYLELSMALAKTIWYFDFERAPGEAGKVGEGIPGRDGWRGRQNEFQLYDGVVVSHDGPNLVFKARERYWEDIEAGETN
ncbi:Isotrichodermin C-15 hydroxylase [Daldinia childiae]|uniref:Isotrichodermin C-15 hydroxylase n=1 Tax=Daldinia childiae TaxID=326645 RepID=UPI001446A891|nr:Isotrichodermin C-15 hydroxylase [Daldinia childiae]KAF3061047.1 Isotrichodermin C-15 hydroxylase [Daldinia childiae]